MADQRIQYTEKMVGAGHPQLPDTLNRMILVEHNIDGTHDTSVLNIEKISATEPTPPTPYQRWYNTTDSKEYIRNRANDAWIEASKIAVGSPDTTVKYTVPRATQVELADNSTLLNGHVGSWYVPAGAIMAFGTKTPPDGWLLCDGRAVSRTTYATLFTAVDSGSLFGTGDGSTTFNLPNLIDRFVRGVDGSTRAVGNYQEDTLKSHKHGTVLGTGVGNAYYNLVANPLTASTIADTALTGDTETRPKNVGVLYCIKY